MTDCLFCKIISWDIESTKIYEDDTFLAFLDINPVNPGHTLLVPKEHFKDLYEVPDEVLSKAGPIMKKIANAIKRGVGADGINIGMNNEIAAGQEIFHAHFHIMPRMSDDGYEMWHGKPYDSDETKKNIAEKIRKSL